MIEHDELFLSHDVVPLFTDTTIDDALTRNDCSRIQHCRWGHIYTLATIWSCWCLSLQRHTSASWALFGTAMGRPVSPVIANGMAGIISIRQSSSNVSAPAMKAIRGRQNGNREERVWRTIDSTRKHHWWGVTAKHWGIDIRNDDWTLKLLVYRKRIHTFSSHHPLRQKLGVIKPLLDRCNSIAIEPYNRGKDHVHIKKVTWQLNVSFERQGNAWETKNIG